MKVKNKKNKYLSFLGIILILLGIIILVIPFFAKEVDNKKNIVEVKKFITKTSSLTRNEEVTKEEVVDNILMVLEIPKINFKRVVYDFNAKDNHIRYNVQIMKESSLPDVINGNLVLSAHNGNASNSFFGRLHLLEKDDLVYVYYNGYKYVYFLDKVYDVLKDGTVEVKREQKKTTLTLVTCKENTLDKQQVFILYLKDRMKY